jgi:hypothetical protein
MSSEQEKESSNAKETTPDEVVVVGSSAGGIEETRQKWGRFFRTFVYPTLVHYLLSR